MLENYSAESGNSILIELQETRGEQDVSLRDLPIAEKSAQALNKAMNTVYSMARRVIQTVEEIPLTERPSEVTVEFGLKLTTDANAFVVNAGTESQITVTLSWKRDKATDSK